jgi:aspartate/methionine/tyrosine aminotransferase
VIDAALRAAAMPPFHAMAMGRAASELEAAGHRILHLEVGQPSTALPRLAADVVRAALDQPLGYTNAAGLHRLRERIAERYDAVDPQRVIVVAGASAGFTLSFLTLFEPGSRVGIFEPGYPCYRNVLAALGVEPVTIPVDPANRWAPTIGQLDAAGHLDGLVVASPANPTGTVYDAEALAMITRFCRRNDIAVVADEIYHGIVYGDPAASILDHEPDAFVVNSFSKYWSMTGWRVGWVVVPDAFVDIVERLQQNMYICAPHVSQVAALAALDATDEIDGHVERYRVNRSALIDGLAHAGLVDIAPADGAFYVYAHATHLTTGLGIDSLELCRRWMREIGVAATSGIDFDLRRGHEYVRFSYAGHLAHIDEACTLLAGWTP